MSPAQTPNTASLKLISTPLTALCSTHRVFALGKHPPTALFWGFTAFVTTLSPADLLSCSWHYMPKLPPPGQMPHTCVFFCSSRQIHSKRELAGVFSWLLVIFSPWGLLSSEGFGCHGVWQPTRQRLPQSASLGCCSFQYAIALCVCCPLNRVPVRHGTVCTG